MQERPKETSQLILSYVEKWKRAEGGRGGGGRGGEEEERRGKGKKEDGKTREPGIQKEEEER